MGENKKIRIEHDDPIELHLHLEEEEDEYTTQDKRGTRPEDNKDIKKMKGNQNQGPSQTPKEGKDIKKMKGNQNQGPSQPPKEAKDIKKKNEKQEQGPSQAPREGKDINKMNEKQEQAPSITPKRGNRPEPYTMPRIYRTNKPTCQYSGAGATPLYCPKQEAHLTNDSFNTEFLYYMGAIKELLPAMSVYGDRIKVLPWLKKLFGPEYQPAPLRLKRNKYLLHLVLIMTNDTIIGIFQDPPTSGKLPEVSHLRREAGPFPRWEKDRYWDELVAVLAVTSLVFWNSYMSKSFYNK